MASGLPYCVASPPRSQYMFATKPSVCSLETCVTATLDCLQCIVKTDNASAHICHALDGLAMFPVWRKAYQANDDKIVIRLPCTSLYLSSPQPADDRDESEKGEDGQDDNVRDPDWVLGERSWRHPAALLVCPANQTLFNRDMLYSNRRCYMVAELPPPTVFQGISR